MYLLYHTFIIFRFLHDTMRAEAAAASTSTTPPDALTKQLQRACEGGTSAAAGHVATAAAEERARRAARAVGKPDWRGGGSPAASGVDRSLPSDLPGGSGRVDKTYEVLSTM